VAQYIEKICELLEPLDVKPIKKINGSSVEPLFKGIQKPMANGWWRAYEADKIKKLCIANFSIMKRIYVMALVIYPTDDYDLPCFVSEWNESGKILSTMVDLLPLTDVVMNEWYVTKYLDALMPLYEKYRKLPGFQPNIYNWFRPEQSPYGLNFRPEMSPNFDKQQYLQVHIDYLGIWLDNWRKAEPLKDSTLKVYANKRKDKIINNFRTKAVDIKSFSELIGKDLGNLLVKCLF
jgi:hypothetical protein